MRTVGFDPTLQTIKQCHDCFQPVPLATSKATKARLPGKACMYSHVYRFYNFGLVSGL